MPKSHQMATGENIFDIADLNGFSPESIWNLPDNKDLVARRKYMNILEEGDILFLPDIQPFSKSYPMDQRHVFRRKGIPAKLRLQLLEDGRPKANLKFTLTVDGVDTIGTTDDQGNLEAFVRPDAIEGELLLEDKSLYNLDFGELVPIDEIRGVQNRLANLGFLSTPANSEWDDESSLALREFQARLHLPETGQLDDITKRKLEEIHDGAGTLPKD